jgi:TRAP-type C4-dicarboxylate transport system permease small subunit
MSEHADIQEPGLKLGEKPPRVPESVERVIGAAVMGLLCLITFGNVLVRYFTNASFAFTEELSVALMVVVALVGASAAFATNRHIRLTFVVERLAVERQRQLELVILLACFGLFALLTWLSASYVWDEYRFEVMSPGLGIPQWRYTVALPVLSFIICLRILGRLARVWQTTRKQASKAGG